MSEWLEIAKAFAPGALLGVVLGWFLSRSEQRRLFKARMLDRSLEEVYGPLVGIVDKREEKMEFVEGSKEPGLKLSATEKEWLDKIMMTYRYMLPEKIWQYWLANIKDLKTRPFKPMTLEDLYYPVGLEFRKLVKEEYDRRLKEYRKLTGPN